MIIMEVIKTLNFFLLFYSLPVIGFAAVIKLINKLTELS
jgi:hypothetical protein